ncbi:MAG TPA: SIS domain-containing protein [Vicinamibacterales bacterium]|nr:SIS domain-containing protein [Vicinamibacterales bacterium]
MRGSDIADAALSETIALHQQVRGAGLDATVAAADAIVAALRQGGKVLVFGNGGSAADAAHAAAELVGRFRRERRGYAAVALTADPSVLTSIANDYGYDRVFARQIEALGQPGDIAFAITTSGESVNALRALDVARTLKLTTIALTGRDGGAAGRLADVHVNVPSESTPRVQEVHRTLLHVICDLVETELSARP